MTEHADPILTERLVKRFGRFEAVRGASFCVRSSSITAFLGENGAGKTTTLRIILGFLRPDSGRVSLCAEKAGFIPERPVFFPRLKGVDIIGATSLKFGIPSAVAEARVEELSSRLSFDLGLLARRADTYSAGNQKKFAYLQSLLIYPSLLVADEPFSTLDPQSIVAVREIFVEMRSEGKTVFLSSHHLSELEKLCDDFLVIRRGRIVARDNLPRLRDGHVFLRFERSLQMTRSSIPLAYPWQITGRFVDWLVPRERLGTIDPILLERAEVRPPDLERLLLFLSD